MSVRAAHPVQPGVLRRPSTREPAARTYARSLPIVPVRARGLTIEGADGRRYLDCLSGAGALALGHNHPVVLEAIRGVLDSGAPLHAPDLATPVRDAFVAELLRTLPPDFARHARVRFCGPGETEAMEAALRLVRATTGRTAVLSLTGSHGGDDPAELWGASGDDELGVHLGDFGAEVARPAGVILEPFAGEGGVVPVPDAWTRRVRRLTAARSVPLIADETQTGVGRTGAFWAVEHSGITPDVMVLSKAVGGSLPLSVVVHRGDLGTGEPGTFHGNQLALAAGTATLSHVRENALALRAATLGSRMLGRLRDLARDVACVGDVRGRGLMIGVEFVDPEAEGAGPELAAAVRRECLRRGLIVDLGGRHRSVVRLLPPLTISDEQAAAVLDRLGDAVEAVTRARRRAFVQAGRERR
ncbi:aminotransferase class III-fold pyridoxal phosphate-dependent enzyme [Streptomyces sp. MBT33]|uniref:aminotransferase class III-fold pyridoxal phosphate-dependent enzyme n=1 Tax=Streptomyces sp. MBT33 TaxID=1488363 RepID=UPI0027DD5ADC|nr:aminotransferase class III-fold pyridoxal phosphate-dependent enzyme [Streptomyces sp. MBT33]